VKKIFWGAQATLLMATRLLESTAISPTSEGLQHEGLRCIKLQLHESIVLPDETKNERYNINIKQNVMLKTVPLLKITI